VAGKTLWIRFKYVKLPDFCYGCGRLGHVLAACDLVEAEEGHSNLQYGACLRASPLKSQRCSAEAELAEEKKLFSVFNSRGAPPKAKAKLHFDNPPSLGEPTGGEPAGDFHSSVMLIDNITPVVLGGEVFKQKQDDTPLTNSADRKVRILHGNTDHASSFIQAEVAVQPRQAP